MDSFTKMVKQEEGSDELLLSRQHSSASYSSVYFFRLWSISVIMSVVNGSYYYISNKFFASSLNLSVQLQIHFANQ